MNERAKPFAEKRSTWSFTTAGGRWVWSVVRPNGERARSEAVFGSLAECIDDAAPQGYVPLKPLIERREGADHFIEGEDLGSEEKP